MYRETVLLLHTYLGAAVEVVNKIKHLLNMKMKLKIIIISLTDLNFKYLKVTVYFKDCTFFKEIFYSQNLQVFKKKLQLAKYRF